MHVNEPRANRQKAKTRKEIQVLLTDRAALGEIPELTAFLN